METDKVPTALDRAFKRFSADCADIGKEADTLIVALLDIAEKAKSGVSRRIYQPEFERYKRRRKRLQDRMDKLHRAFDSLNQRVEALKNRGEISTHEADQYTNAIAVAIDGSHRIKGTIK
jgi:predicted  nucleic acid-binding Zn-ribbon protein